MVTFSTVDLLLIAAYFVAVLLIGFLSKSKSEAADFLLAGRSLTLPLFVMTLVSTWYGGILGVGEFSYLYGISNWVVQGVPYYIFALLFALFLARRIRESNLLTIPDKLQQSYDRKTAILGSILTFILTTPAPYVLMLAMLLQLVTGWGYVTCLFIGTISTTVYLYFGGFRADVNTDVFEFVLMFIGFAVIIPFAYDKFGGFDFIQRNVPHLHLTWNGGNSIQFVLVWFFIALWTLVDPAFHQRCYAAKSGEVAQRGILISIIFWFIFDAMTATAGLYARAALPLLDQPVMAFPLLAEVTLPPIAKGMFYIGMLATIMSSLNTLAFISATTLGRDIVWRWKNEGDDSNVARYTKAGLIVTAALSIALSIAIPSVIKLWYTIGTVIVPGLLIPLMASYSKRLRISSGFAFTSMLFGWVGSVTWLLLGWTGEIGNSALYPFEIEPIYPGLLISATVWTAGVLYRERQK
ncbi:MAG: sodium:solute symporter family protein [Bacteroidetes bacterium]|nr:sodium:solute symporter family protein [Bacteroidota bacterium]MCW5896833.1 sodium:solute symporter family protein [Bacteroidota bacterium]